MNVRFTPSESFSPPSATGHGRGRTDHLVMPEDHMDQLYSSRNPIVRLIHLGRLDAIVRQVPPAASLRLLDAGCGEGHLLERLHLKYPHYRYHGVDVTEVSLKRACQRCSFAEFKRANLIQTGFPDQFFDLITSTEVIEHIYEYRAVITEILRILRPGGLLIITYPNEALWTLGRFFLGRRPVKVPDHVNSFTPNSIASAIPLHPEKQLNLPFSLPFFLSLTGLTVFKKTGGSI